MFYRSASKTVVQIFYSLHQTFRFRYGVFFWEHNGQSAGTQFRITVKLEINVMSKKCFSMRSNERSTSTKVGIYLTIFVTIYVSVETLHQIKYLVKN
jgi:hypothetical protein